MSQFGYHGTPSLAHGQGHQLTPLSNLPTDPYANDSPGPPQVLPPIHAKSRTPSYSQATTYTPSASSTRETKPPLSPGLSSRSRNSLDYGHYGSTQPPSSFATLAPTFSSIQHVSPKGLVPQHTPQNVQLAGHHAMPLSQTSSAASPFGQPQTQPQRPAFGYFNNQQDQYQPVEQRQLPVVNAQIPQTVLPPVSARAGYPDLSNDRTPRPGAPPVKNADGKFPCAYCSKTYLHLKHLKRHHLRHTGERPYQCCLCNETFCRSDILKRHFNKCQVRRGNPTGATHLTHAQAHLKASQPTVVSNVPANVAAVPAPVNPPPTFRGPWHAAQGGTLSNFGQDQLQPNPVAVESTRSSRSSSIMRPESSSSEDKASFTTAISLPTLNVPMAKSAGHHFPANRTQPADRGFAPAPFGRDITNYQEPAQHAHGYQSSTGPFAASAQADHNLGYARGSYGHVYHGSQPGQAPEHEWTSYMMQGQPEPLMFTSS